MISSPCPAMGLREHSPRRPLASSLAQGFFICPPTALRPLRGSLTARHCSQEVLLEHRVLIHTAETTDIFCFRIPPPGKAFYQTDLKLYKVTHKNVLSEKEAGRAGAASPLLRGALDSPRLDLLYECRN